MATARCFLGSDAIALSAFHQPHHLSGGWRLAVLTHKGLEIFDAKGEKVSRPMSFSQASAMLVDKGNHRHFMAKEIASSRRSVSHTLAEYINFAEHTVRVPELPFDFAKLDRLTITACGTASYAGLTAKYWFERIARLPTESTSPPSSATARRRCRRTALQSSSPNPAKRRTRLRHCATARLKASTRSPSSTCRNQRSRVRARRCSALCGAPRSALPPPRPSPAS